MSLKTEYTAFVNNKDSDAKLHAQRLYDRAINASSYENLRADVKDGNAIVAESDNMAVCLHFQNMIMQGIELPSGARLTYKPIYVNVEDCRAYGGDRKKCKSSSKLHKCIAIADWTK